jgi:hypothetical protein
MYRVSNGVRITQNHDGAILLDIQQGRILRLNIAGALIFERLQKGQDEAQIANGISESFRISPEMVQTDLREFLKSLERQGLVHNNTPEGFP